MKDQILKLCKRLKKCTLNDILQLMEIQPEVLKLALMYLIHEGAIQEKDGVYTAIPQKTKKGEFENKNLKLMFMFHSSETVDLIMRGFCALIPTHKLSHLVGVDDNCIGDFYRIFRNLIYERQLNELLNFYFTNPQQGRFRKFFEKYAYFYSYNNKIYVSKKLLQANREKNFTDAEIQDFKKVYSYLSRIESHNMNEVCLHQRLAEGIWRREKEFQELYEDLKNNLIT